MMTEARYTYAILDGRALGHDDCGWMRFASREAAEQHVQLHMAEVA